MTDKGRFTTVGDLEIEKICEVAGRFSDEYFLKLCIKLEPRRQQIIMNLMNHRTAVIEKLRTMFSEEFIKKNFLGLKR